VDSRVGVEAQRAELDEVLELIDFKLDSFRDRLRDGVSPIRAPEGPEQRNTTRSNGAPPA